MTTDRYFTALCGLYCLDCIPSQKALFETIAKLEEQFADLQFEKYAELKSADSKVLAEYPIFQKVLHEIRRLECTSPCFAGPQSDLGCKPNCPVRECAQKKHYEGCWQCDSSGACTLLEPLKKIHPSLSDNLRVLKEFGPADWSKKRGKHYCWS